MLATLRRVGVKIFFFKTDFLHFAAGKPTTRRLKHRGNVRRRAFGASESSWGCTLDRPQPINIRHSGRGEECELQGGYGNGDGGTLGVARVDFCGKNAIFAERFGGSIRQCEELLVCKCIELIHTVLTQNCAHAM